MEGRPTPGDSDLTRATRLAGSLAPTEQPGVEGAARRERARGPSRHVRTSREALADLENGLHPTRRSVRKDLRELGERASFGDEARDRVSPEAPEQLQVS